MAVIKRSKMPDEVARQLSVPVANYPEIGDLFRWCAQGIVAGGALSYQVLLGHEIEVGIKLLLMLRQCYLPYKCSEVNWNGNRSATDLKR